MHYGKAVEHNPEEGEYHAHYGWCLHLIHPDDSAMIGEAIEHVRRGIKLARDHEKPYLFLGRLYKVLGRGKAAEKMFTHAVQIRPDSVEAMRELRLLNMRRNKNKGLIGRLLRR
jgi:tetratricopeptide (TPR) repeat protein